MKKLIIIITLFSINKVFSQSPSVGGGGEAVDSATMYLTGTFKKYNPQRAFQINLQNANSGNAKAMNAVAIQYMKGLGVDSNINLAIYWFNQAATSNYTKALVNLGMLYKHNATDSLGYSVACGYFNQALQVNEPSAFFAKGYMLYKGLGCTQSYTSALALFNQGIAINQANCMYFKGLCYKFGYGVTVDNDSANYYINKAALLGYKQANAELYNNSNSTVARHSTPNKKTETTPNTKLQTDEFVAIEKTNKIIQLNGTYNGLLNQYDYSGKKLITQIPITLNITAQENKIAGTLQFNNDAPFNIQAIQQGNQLIFSQTTIKTTQQKHQTPNSKQSLLVFKNATVNIQTVNDSSFLTGTLQLFNTFTHETDKPINIKLSQQVISRSEAISQTPNNVSVFPNPTTGSFTISFDLTKPSPVKINIFNPQGQAVYIKVLDMLQAGKQNIVIPSFKGQAGIYTTVVNANGSHETIAFIKE